MQIYDQMYAYINGKLLAENTSIGTELTGNQQEVDTLVRGFAGISPGPDKRTISLEYVIPISCMEFEFVMAYLHKAELDVRLQQGGSGRKYEGKGFVQPGIKIDSGVGKTTTLSFSLVCDPGAFE